jgi:surfeit locus 1 family protein
VADRRYRAVAGGDRSTAPSPAWRVTFRFRPQFWPTVCSVPALLLLLGLGTWQIEQLFWKEDLIGRRAAAVAAPPVPLPRTPDEARPLEFHRVFADGVFLHAKEIYLGASAGPGTAGYHVFTPLEEPDGPIVFVNRGYIPQNLRNPDRRASGQIRGRVRVAGLLRLPPAGRPNWFWPDNRPDRNDWFWIDLQAMAAAENLERVAPFYIDADAAPNPGGWPRGGVTNLELPNHHLQYAITWFSLAVAVIVIYFLHHRRRAGPG